MNEENVKKKYCENPNDENSVHWSELSDLSDYEDATYICDICGILIIRQI
jgi:hypothetical protein